MIAQVILALLFAMATVVGRFDFLVKRDLT
jgi:hypothetical protein